MAGARQIVDGPAFTTLPHGLWDTVQKPVPAGPSWQQGITWIERCPDGDTTYDPCLAVTGTGTPPPPPPLADNAEQNTRAATPFTVYAEFDCSPVGLLDAGTVAADALARVEQRQVEAALWTGRAAGQQVVHPRLAADAPQADPGDPRIVLQTAAAPVVTGADAAEALGALEAGLARCSAGQGLLHIPPSALPTLAAWGLARETAGTLLTPAGNRIVVGSGYPGTGPDGAAPAPGTTWIYATGPAFGYRSQIRLSRPRDSLDRANNTQRMLAERTYALGFACCHFAAHITLGVPTQ